MAQGSPKRIRSGSKSLGHALRLLRLRLHLEQQELADRLNLKKQRLGSYERGTYEPSIGLLREMLAGMGLDLHDLQDALDLAEGRPPRTLETGPPAEDPQRAENPFLAYGVGLMRFFAVLVANEVKQVLAPPARMPVKKTRRAKA
jgi:transcriptional regulator with XRE-family HTH domain